jgi:pyrroloquinoline quinone biosynthesis protein E
MILKTPLEVFWCLTDRCNLRCNFCLSESDSMTRQDELRTEERSLILDDLIGSGVLKVYLTGGEPLLIPETLDYAKYLREHGIFTVLTTNGVLLDPSTIRLLSEYGLNRIQVSIHGSTPEINDSIMGGHAFERIMQALGEIHDSGIDLHIKVTLTKQNIQGLALLIQKLLPFEPSLINVSEVTATGRGFLNYESIQPFEEELQKAREDVEAFNKQGANVSFRSHTLHFAETGRPSTCTVGSETASTCLILPDGNMTPCTPAYIWGLSINVLDYGIKEAWEQLPLYAQYLNPEKLQGRCRSCKDVHECKGGCRAEAYCYTHDVWGEYTNCNRISQTGKVKRV